MEGKNSVYPTMPEPTNADYSVPPPPYYATQQQPPPVINVNNSFGAQPSTVYHVSTANVPPGTVIIQPQRWFPLSKQPVSMNCPQCNAIILTRVSRQTGAGTWLISGGICLAGCIFPILWFGCCLLPFCIDDCKDATHHCPNCNAYIGTHTL